MNRLGAALEANWDGTAGLGALRAAAGGFTLGAFTTTHTDLGLIGSPGGTQVVQLEDACGGFLSRLVRR